MTRPDRLALSSALLPIALLTAAAPAGTQPYTPEPVDLEMVTRIRDEGFRRSQVMDTARHLTDGIGARLTGSPAMAEAARWTRDRLAEWGLEASLHELPFGEGWTVERSTVRMLAPDPAPLHALPEAWTPATDGPVRGTAMRLDLGPDTDLEEHHGELAGKILLLDGAREAEDPEGAEFRRYEDHELADLGAYEIPRSRGPGWRERARKRWQRTEEVNRFLIDEGVVATIEISSRDNGVLRLGGGGSRGLPGRSRGVPSLVMAAEHYNRLVRLLDDEVEDDAGAEVELEIDVAARFHPDGGTVHNTIAELPGGDLADQVVMAGAHLDSWHPATGATDNAGSCAVVMEALRILEAIGAKPRRTLRIGLWTGEEQGLLGSRAYVDDHLATRPQSDDPDELALPPILRRPTWPIQPRPAHADFSAYFNLDNGGGKIRGIYAQENAAARPIFDAWLAPFADLGATTVTLRNTGGTDHLAFDRVGLPGFQFVQDRLDYFSRTHHTDLDTFDHLREEDLKQAAVVLASFLYHAAMRDELLPRKPMPQQPPGEREPAAAGNAR